MKRVRMHATAAGCSTCGQCPAAGTQAVCACGNRLATSSWTSSREAKVSSLVISNVGAVSGRVWYQAGGRRSTHGGLRARSLPGTSGWPPRARRSPRAMETPSTLTCPRGGHGGIPVAGHVVRMRWPARPIAENPSMGWASPGQAPRCCAGGRRPRVRRPVHPCCGQPRQPAAATGARAHQTRPGAAGRRCNATALAPDSFAAVSTESAAAAFEW